jgi:hypothetical protein
MQLITSFEISGGGSVFFDANDSGTEPTLKDGCKVATQVALQVSRPAGLKTLGDER